MVGIINNVDTKQLRTVGEASYVRFEGSRYFITPDNIKPVTDEQNHLLLPESYIPVYQILGYGIVGVPINNNSFINAYKKLRDSDDSFILPLIKDRKMHLREAIDRLENKTIDIEFLNEERKYFINDLQKIRNNPNTDDDINYLLEKLDQNTCSTIHLISRVTKCIISNANVEHFESNVWGIFLGGEQSQYDRKTLDMDDFEFEALLEKIKNLKEEFEWEYDGIQKIIDQAQESRTEIIIKELVDKGRNIDQLV